VPHLQKAIDQATTYRNRTVLLWETCLAGIVSGPQIGKMMDGTNVGRGWAPLQVSLGLGEEDAFWCCRCSARLGNASTLRKRSLCEGSYFSSRHRVVNKSQNAATVPTRFQRVSCWPPLNGKCRTSNHLRALGVGLIFCKIWSTQVSSIFL
jgi:hypothetical protein